MARKRKHQVQGGTVVTATWLITLTDLMTLLMTFFVVLVSLAVFDERSKQYALESVGSVFGQKADQQADFAPGLSGTVFLGDGQPSESGSDLGELGTQFMAEGRPSGSGSAPSGSGSALNGSGSALNDSRPDPDERGSDLGGSGATAGDSLPSLRSLLMGDTPEIALSQNSKILLLSFNSDLLFEPGGLTLSSRGRALLDKLVPYVTAMRYPMRIAGHSSPERDSLNASGQNGTGQNGAGLPGGGPDAALNQTETHAVLNQSAAHAAWTASMERSLAVYRHFLARGAAPANLIMEAHGDSRPHFSNDTPEGRQGNRRVVLVLDKRNPMFAGAAEGLRQSDETRDDYYFKDFRFELEYPNRKSEPNQPGFSQTSVTSSVPSVSDASDFAGAARDYRAGVR